MSRNPDNRCNRCLPVLLVFMATVLLLPLMSQEKKPEKQDRPRPKKVDPDLPMVLIIGDSISIGYTPHVKKALAGKANVLHNPGNSQGTTHGLKHIKAWLAPHQWDVIHFNFGLHDLKRVKEAGTAENSNVETDPRQADLETYSANLSKIVAELKKTDAALIFGTTTPFPAGVRPFRSPEDAGRYNKAARDIMMVNDIEINDLHHTILPHLDTHQKKINVHFKPEGSVLLGKTVTEKINAALEAITKKESK